MSYKISILIPVYNTEKYLRQCLDSVFNQTLKDIEVIAVNDGSTDSSLDILNEYKEKNFLTIIDLKQNEGLARARYHAINKASGDYIMFLDSDDYLELDACEIAYNEITKKDFDIIHFGTNIVCENVIDKNELRALKEYLSLKPVTLKGTQILGDCYIRRYYSWNVWNKIYRASIVKNIAEYIPNENITMSEDMMLYFFISFFADNYKTIPNKLINYRVGTGVSTKGINLKSYISHLKRKSACEAIENFVKAQHIEKHDWIEKLIEELNFNTDYDAVSKLIFDIPMDKGGEAFDEYLKYYTVDDFIKCLTFIDFYSRDELIKKISKSNFVRTRQRKDIKTIGIFYYRYHNGGVERVISKLMPLLLKLGYRVVFYTEQVSKKDDFKLPEGVKHYILPSSAYVSPKEYLAHAEEFKLHLIKDKIDIMLYQASVAYYMLEEILICKSLNIPFVITTHDYYSSTILAQDYYMVYKRALYSMCDKVQTITTEEEYAYKEMGINAKYIPNPLTFSSKSIKPSTLDSLDIGWVGRIDFKQKCPQYAIEAISKVSKTYPNVKLHIIGSSQDKKDMNYLNGLIKSFKLSNNVILHGFNKNTEQFYPQFSMLLMTSSYEVFPMTIEEAMSFGLPIVLFDLPYVELLKDSKCYLSAPQMDVNKLSKNIIRVLSDEKLRKEMSQASLDKIQELKKFDYLKAWKEFIEEIGKGESNIKRDNPLNTILDIAYLHWDRSLHENFIKVPPKYLYDPEKYVVIEKEYPDYDALFSAILYKKTKIRKAFFFLVYSPLLFCNKILNKIIPGREEKQKLKRKEKIAKLKKKKAERIRNKKHKEKLIRDKKKAKLLAKEKEASKVIPIIPTKNPGVNSDKK